MITHRRVQALCWLLWESAVFPGAMARFPLVKREVASAAIEMTRRVLSLVEVPDDAVGDGSIEEREVASRQRVELVRNELDRLVAELKEAEAARDRLVIAKETVSEVLSEAGEPKDVRVSRGRPVEPEPPVVRAVPGSVEIEQVRSKAKRLAASGWLVEDTPAPSASLFRKAAAHDHGHCPQHRLLRRRSAPAG
ncbi:hypothetical protein [Streptomyces sp. NPDC001774]